jgi:hypothetical protein
MTPDPKENELRAEETKPGEDLAKLFRDIEKENGAGAPRQELN